MRPTVFGRAGHAIGGGPRVGSGLSRILAVRERSIEPERPPCTVREGGFRICFVADPDSYRIELIERG
jgi:lactoylglutathione lyase